MKDKGDFFKDIKKEFCKLLKVLFIWSSKTQYRARNFHAHNFPESYSDEIFNHQVQPSCMSFHTQASRVRVSFRLLCKITTENYVHHPIFIYILNPAPTYRLINY